MFPVVLFALLCLARVASAQWATESFPLVAGWNAIWLPLDCSDRKIDTILPVSVEEIWQWNPSSSASTFTQSPVRPVQPDVQWVVWKRVTPVGGNALTTLTGQNAYLVKVADGTAAFNLSLTGKPLLPAIAWKSSGVNLVGFPTVPTGTPNFYSFFSYDPVLRSAPSIFQYVGGPLSDVAPRNPALVTAPAATPVVRNQAYWVQSTDYTDFSGPLAITTTGTRGVDFGDTLLTTSVRVKNSSDPAKGSSLTATLTPVVSTAAPTADAAGARANPTVAGPVPLLVRGAFNPTTGTYAYAPLGASLTTPSLAPGESTVVVLAVNRSTLGGAARDVFQSLLRVTDSLGLTRIDLPVTATSTSFDGIWVGAAVADKVDQVLSRGGVVTTTAAQPAAPFSLRLILQSGASATKLLQQVFVANDATGQPKASIKETSIKAVASSTGRIARLTSASFPPATTPPSAGAPVGLTGAATFSIVLPAGAATNPFIHAYHPDHDNLDAKFTGPAGPAESYQVTRNITLTFQSTLPGVSDTDPSWGSTTLGGTFTETLTGLRSTPFSVAGIFVIRRVSAASTLLP